MYNYVKNVIYDVTVGLVQKLCLFTWLESNPEKYKATFLNSFFFSHFLSIGLS